MVALGEIERSSRLGSGAIAGEIRVSMLKRLIVYELYFRWPVYCRRRL